MTIDKDFFRQVMGHFATGVTVVTARHKDILAGLTVNAFCSVSLEPPLVLICVDHTSNTLPVIRASKAFAVNMLTEEQEHLSRGFATHSRERFEHFCYASHYPAVTGSPILDDTLAFIDTRIVAEYPGGDHVIFLGQIEAMGYQGKTILAEGATLANGTLPGTTNNTKEQTPLLYYQGQYRHLAEYYMKPSLAETYDEVKQ